MNQKLGTLLFFVLFTVGISAQSQVENILRDAKSFNDAYLAKDFETYVEMTVPSIVELAGGSEVMVRVSKEHYETMTASGLEFISFVPNKPGKIMLGGNDLHSILPQELITKKGSHLYKKTAYFLASSNDEGKTWTFVDLEPYDNETIKTFVPSFTGDLEIPNVEYAEKIEQKQ